jgi:hypothetical protein
MTTSTKREQSGATKFKVVCKRTSLNGNFTQRQALLLNFVRFWRLAHRLPMVAPHPARRTRAVREASGKTSCGTTGHRPGCGRAVASALFWVSANHSARQLARCFAAWPRNVPAMARHWQRNATERLARRLSRRLAMSTQAPCETSCETPRNSQGNVLQAACWILAVSF